jgi:carboxypeptidase N regulatory subunit
VFAGLSTLVTIALSGNTLSTLPAGVFADLGALTSLEISDNSLTRLDAGSFAGLARLSALLLDHNSIVDVHQSALAQLRALQVRRLQRSIDAASPLTPALILVIAAQPKSRFCRGSI